VEDHAGALLFPGLVDAQVHAGSVEGFAGLRDATRAAAAGGVTTIVDMPFDEPAPVNSPELLARKIAAIGQHASVDVALYVTAPKTGDYRALREMARAGAAAVKLSTYEYHPVRFPRFTTAEMYEIFKEAADIGLPVAFHNEDQEIVTHLVARAIANGDRSAAAHGSTRPPLAELVADAQILELASHTGVRCHIVHSSVAAGNKIAGRYKALGAKVSVETCIHYLVFNEDDMLRQGAFLKLNPPIRRETERLQLWESLQAGEIDLVSTDHVAWPESRKRDSDIFKNGSGIPGLETLLAAFYTGAVAERALSPTLVARLASENPARHFGLFPRKGQLAVGADADVAVLQRGLRAFDQAAMVSAVKWSPYHGREMAGTVAATYLRGRKVFEHGRVLVEGGHGQFIRPAA
jgi:allantoinase